MSEYLGVGQDISELAPSKIAFSRALPPIDGIFETTVGFIDALEAIDREGRTNPRKESIPTTDEIFDGKWFADPYVQLVHDRQRPEDSFAVKGTRESPDWRRNYPDCLAPDEFLHPDPEVSELDSMLEGLPPAHLVQPGFSTSERNEQKRERRLKSRDWIVGHAKGRDGSDIVARLEARAPEADDFEVYVQRNKQADEPESYSSDHEPSTDIRAEREEAITLEGRVDMNDRKREKLYPYSGEYVYINRAPRIDEELDPFGNDELAEDDSTRDELDGIASEAYERSSVRAANEARQLLTK